MTQDKIIVSNLLIIGDSLTDRGAMYERKLLGIIPMKWLSGLQGKSPKGRFTNGYIWSDLLASFILDQVEINKIKTNSSMEIDIDKDNWLKFKSKLKPYYVKDNGNPSSYTIEDLQQFKYSHNQFRSLFDINKPISMLNCEISDAYITNDKIIDNYKVPNDALDDPKKVSLNKNIFFRTFAEGGLTAYNWTTTFTTNLKNLFSRWILKTLDTMRKLIFKDDSQRKVSDRDKQNTLVIEWSGANDLITVNSRPTNRIALKAVNARIQNIEILISKGYNNFVLFNLPDLSQTPRYKHKKKHHANDAYLASRTFNQELLKEINSLKKKYPQCQFDIFNIDSLIKVFLKNPKSFGLDPDKIDKSYLDDCQNPINTDGTSPANGYAFWDDVHPTSDIWAILVGFLENMLAKSYKINPTYKLQPFQSQDFVPPSLELKLIGQFKDAYSEKLSNDTHSLLGHWRRSCLPNFSDATKLQDILQHGLFKNNRTNKTLKDLGWINKNNQASNNAPQQIKSAIDELQEAPKAIM